jgi:uncharacterized short protein YbdD (DUF466 family)
MQCESAIATQWGYPFLRFVKPPMNKVDWPRLSQGHRKVLVKRLRVLWEFVRELSGDDAYDRYLQRHSRQHPDAKPLDKRAYFKQVQKQKWSELRRCC